jgi:hypothetical protein
LRGEATWSRSPTTVAVDGEPVSGTGLSIVRALVRDELDGTLTLGPTAASGEVVELRGLVGALDLESPTVRDGG